MDQLSREAAFARDGIVFPIRAMPAEDAGALARYLGDIEARFGGKLPSEINHKIHLLSPRLYDLVCSPAITDAVAEILGPDLLCWGASFFIKHPHDPAFVSWHQDATYWGLSSNDVVTAWVALTPSRVANGCLRVVAGSHHRQQLPHVETHAEENLLSRGQEIAVAVDPEAATDVILEPGEMSFHHVLIVHGSEPNAADYPRIGFAIRYIPAAMRQTDGTRTTATLARGADRYGHFDPEARPAADFDERALAHHRAALRRQQAGLFKPGGAEETKPAPAS